MKLGKIFWYLWLGLFADCLFHAGEMDINAQTADSLNPAPNNIVYSTIPLPDGSILVGGGFNAIGGYTNILPARIRSDGSIDPAFTNKVTTSGATLGINCLAFQTNGQVLIGGAFMHIGSTTNYCYNLARLNGDGTVDTNFNAPTLMFNGLISSGASSVNCIALQPDGKILVGGNFTRITTNSVTGLCRFNSNGSLDTTFNAAGNGSVNSIALQPDGKILALGSFTSMGGAAQTNFSRLNPDGTADTSFQVPRFIYSGRASAVFFNYCGGAILVQPDGKILVGGVFQTVNGENHTNLVRLNVNGTVDSAFTAQADLYDCLGFQTFALQADGKIIIGDDSHTINGQACPLLGRLNVDGSRDADFQTNIATGSVVYNAVLQPDGKILVAGGIAKLAGQPRAILGRLLNTTPATQCLTNDGTTITWFRGGSSPEVWRTTFETTLDQTNWTYLGVGTRISGGWQLTQALIPTNQTIRARGFLTGGIYNGSCWFVESIAPQATPSIVTGDGKLGCHTNQFGFNLSGSAGTAVVIESTTDFIQWTPVATNCFYSQPTWFTDPDSTNSSRKFYRLRQP